MSRPRKENTTDKAANKIKEKQTKVKNTKNCKTLNGKNLTKLIKSKTEIKYDNPDVKLVMLQKCVECQNDCKIKAIEGAILIACPDFKAKLT